MSETIEGVELAVPDESVQALLNINPYYDADDEAEADARAVATPVVVAELRRLSDERMSQRSSASRVLALRLRHRADELEAQS